MANLWKLSNGRGAWNPNVSRPLLGVWSCESKAVDVDSEDKGAVGGG